MDLSDLQGNVLQGYGLPTAAYVNLWIRDGRDGCRLLDDLAGSVTDANRWYDGRPQATLNLAIAYAGLERLGITRVERESFPVEYREGMAARADRLGDVGESAPARWDVDQIHVLAIIHAASPVLRAEAIARLEHVVARRAGVDALRIGEAALLDDGLREHFGFSDGFGQPAIEGQTGPDYPGQGKPVKRLGRRGWEMLKPGEFVIGEPNEDGGMEPGPVSPLGGNGTFMVFRKLEQDVVGFRALAERLAHEHFNRDVGLTMAKIVGRWPDGTATMLSPDAPDPALAADRWRTNDFRYEKDPRGFTCPLGAHIRRANPRDGLFGGAVRSRRHRIIRRGMPYGPTLPQGAPGDGVQRGLFFVCFNASILRQFETINRWLRSGEVFGLAHGDLLTDGNGAPTMTVQGNPPVILRPPDDMARRPLVTTRGGEYLFLPGKQALRELALGPLERTR